MIQFVVGAAAGYVFGTKAGRERFEQIKKGYQATVSSPVFKSMIDSTRRAVAEKIDPQPRMKEVKNVKRESTEGNTILEPENRE